MLEKSKPNYYGQLPAEVRYDPDLSAGAKVLYAELAALSNAKKYCWASNHYFMSIYEVSRRTIQTWLSKLSQKGYIHIEQSTEGEQRKIWLTCSATQGAKNFTPGGEKNFANPMKKTAPRILKKNKKKTSSVPDYFLPPTNEAQRKLEAYEEQQLKKEMENND